MVTRSNIIYSIAAAQRILNIKSGLYDVQEWAFVVWVRGKNFCKFVSKKLFKKHFADFRKKQAEKVNLVVNPNNSKEFNAAGSAGTYTLNAEDKAIKCTCEDFRNQVFILKTKHSTCKHGYAVLSHLGFKSLSDYIERDRTCERVDVFKSAPVSLSNGSWTTANPRPKGRSVD